MDSLFHTDGETFVYAGKTFTGSVRELSQQEELYVEDAEILLSVLECRRADLPSIPKRNERITRAGQSYRIYKVIAEAQRPVISIQFVLPGNE